MALRWVSSHQKDVTDNQYRLLLLLLLLTAELTLLLAPTPGPYTSAIYAMLPTLPGPLHVTLQPLIRPFHAVLLLISRSLTSSPQFIQIRTLHRLFTSLSIGISQLAGVWSTPTFSPEQALMQATVLAKQLEADCESWCRPIRDIVDETAVGDFHREVVPMLRRGNPAQVQAFLKDGMQEGQCSSAMH
jgi:hypothetical protein